MIVVDINTIAYLYLPTEHTYDVVSLLLKDPLWAAPLLWRSEFRNVLALYIRKNMIDLNTAIAMQAQAERQMTDHEYNVSSMVVLNEIGIISQLSRAKLESRLNDGLTQHHFGALNHLVRLGDGRTPWRWHALRNSAINNIMPDVIAIKATRWGFL